MPAGRPTEYRQEYCGKLIDAMSKGLSLQAAMGEIGYGRARAHEWAKSFPEFRDAIELGHAKRSAFLEKRGLSAESGPAVTFAIAALKNCNPLEFRDNVQHELVGANGGPIETVTRIERVIVRPDPA